MQLKSKEITYSLKTIKIEFISLKRGVISMIYHLVIFKFSSSTTINQKNEAIKKMYALKEEISGIIDIHAGHNFSERSKGYEIGLTVTLKDRKSLEYYGPHRKHQEVSLYLKEIGLEDVIVVDYEV